MPAKQSEIFSHLMPVGQIFDRQFRYKVPAHQRDFSWTSEEIQQLWDDLQDAIREDRADYFLGSIVVQEDRDAKLRIIIDGQQRLAALTMIFSAIRTVYAEQQPKDERADEVYSDFLGQRDRRTRMIEPFISMNEVNEPFFRTLVVADASDGDLRAAASDKTLSKSNILLTKAMQSYRSQVRKATKAVANYENFLLQLEEFVRNRVVAIMVRVSDEADAYLIFETLNDRGLELSSSDLLKNYIFGRAGQYLDTVRNQWREMIVLLGTGNETQFVRHYWLSKFGVVRDRDLFKEMKAKFSSQSAVLGLMSELRSAADKYAAISSVDNPIWLGYGSSVRRQIEILNNKFDLSQFRPLLLAALDQLEEQQIPKVINVILMVSMRYSIIGSLGPGNIEKAYSDAAIAIRRSEVDTAAKIFSLLKNIYPDDQRFEEDFAAKSIPKSDLARYILSEIENHVRGETMLAVNEDEKVTTIEHIMPKTRSGAWARAARDEDEYLSYVNRLGNLALLLRGENRVEGNAPFARKKAEAYSLSEISITRNLGQDGDSWTVADIEKRQRSLAKLAVKIWRLPYQ